MSRIFIFSMTAIAIAFAAECSNKVGQITISNPENALRTKLGDFKQRSKTKIYDKDNLWNFVDGAAESYLSYGFKKAAIADYANGTTDITVQILSFDKPLDAFGIYAENRAPDDNFINMGTEGFLAPGYLMFYRGGFFIRINSFNQNIENSILKSVGDIIDGEIDVSNTRPIEYEKFPKSSIVMHSERYLPSGFLDSVNLLAVFTVEVKIDTLAATMFYFQDQSGMTKLQSWISRHGNAIDLSTSPYKAVFKSGTAQETIIAGEKNGLCFGVLSLTENSKLDSLFIYFGANIK
jgi:hypothetical protein